MTTDEKRAIRRELINLVIHEHALKQLLYTLMFPDRLLSYTKQFVREYELQEFNQELSIYSKGE